VGKAQSTASSANALRAAEVLVMAHRLMGLCYMKRREFDDALKEHRAALDVCRSFNLQRELQRALCNIGVTLFDRAQDIDLEVLQPDPVLAERRHRYLQDSVSWHRQALESALTLLRALETADDKENGARHGQQGLAMSDRTGAAVSASQMPSSSRNISAAAQQMIARSKAQEARLDLLEAVANAYYNMGNALDELKKPHEALENHRLALDRMKEYRSLAVEYGGSDKDVYEARGRELSSKICSGLGLCCSCLDRVNAAIEFIMKSVPAGKTDPAESCLAHRNLGLVYMRARQFRNARKEYQRALAFAVSDWCSKVFVNIRVLKAMHCITIVGAG